MVWDREGCLHAGGGRPTEAYAGFCGQLVFPSDTGTGARPPQRPQPRLLQAGGKTQLNRAGERTLTFHDLRHVFASILIAEGNNVVYVSRQMGQAKPSITLNVYAHLFEAEEQAKKTRDGLERRFGVFCRAPSSR